jgi:hypothetical protein
MSSETFPYCSVNQESGWKNPSGKIRVDSQFLTPRIFLEENKVNSIEKIIKGGLEEEIQNDQTIDKM